MDDANTCENCECEIDSESWCCESCFSKFDGERFITDEEIEREQEYYKQQSQIESLKSELAAMTQRAERAEAEIKRRDSFKGCDGCSTGDCPHDNYPTDCINAQAKIIAEQEARIVKAEAVVGKLPRDLENNTVFVGDTVWRIQHSDTPERLTVASIDELGRAIVRRFGEYKDFVSFQFYRDKAAAEAALAQRGEGE